MDYVHFKTIMPLLIPFRRKSGVILLNLRCRITISVAGGGELVILERTLNWNFNSIRELHKLKVNFNKNKYKFVSHLNVPQRYSRNNLLYEVSFFGFCRIFDKI